MSLDTATGFARSFFMLGICWIAMAVWPTAALGQARVRGLYHPSMAIPEHDRETRVFREHVVAVLPPTYLGMPRPVPPKRGYYAWKLTFNGSTPVTLVLRTDSAVVVENDRTLLRHLRLYSCREATQPVLECMNSVQFKARNAREHIELDIMDPTLSLKIRAARPSLLHRQLFEPGGRFRVDEVGVLVR